MNERIAQQALEDYLASGAGGSMSFSQFAHQVFGLSQEDIDLIRKRHEEAAVPVLQEIRLSAEAERAMWDRIQEMTNNLTRYMHLEGVNITPINWNDDVYEEEKPRFAPATEDP